MHICICCGHEEEVHAVLPLPVQVENVRLLDRVSPKRSRVGTLYLTATHSIFVENEAQERKETWVGASEVLLIIWTDVTFLLFGARFVKYLSEVALSASTRCFTVWCAVWRSRRPQPQDVLCSFGARTSRSSTSAFPGSRTATMSTCLCSVSPSQVSSATKPTNAW